MSTTPINKSRSISQRVYSVLLIAYPAEFRREYGPYMVQVFGDCHHAREKAGKAFGIASLWLNTLVDLLQTAPKERLEQFGKDNSRMNNNGRNAIGVMGSIGIIIVAFGLLRYGITHETSWILIFGHVLDAVATAGIVGNLIVFLLVKFTKWNPTRIALWTFAIVNAVPAVALAIIGSRVDPQFRLGATSVAYLVSFLFWFGLHWSWNKNRPQLATK